MCDMDVGGYQYEVRKDFLALQEEFKRNFDHLSEEELRMFKAKVLELLDLLKSNQSRRHLRDDRN